jgi:hypothetical protein
MLTLKPTHKASQDYYAELDGLAQLNLLGEGAVAPAFAALLRHCTRSTGYTLAEQYVGGFGAWRVAPGHTSSSARSNIRPLAPPSVAQMLSTAQKRQIACATNGVCTGSAPRI